MMPTFLESVITIAKKELKVHFKTKRLIVIGIIFAAVFLIISVWGGYIMGSSQDEPVYEQGAAKVLSLVFSFSGFFPPILAIALTYDSIVGERVNNSMYLLASKPIKKESVYVGKFLGAWGAIAIVYMAVMSFGYAIIIGLTGGLPSAADVANVYLAVFIILIGTAAWISMTMMFSSVFKTTASTLITAVLMWLFVLSLISQSGLIYYMVTAPAPDHKVSAEISYGPFLENQTVVSISGFKYGQDIEGFDAIIKDDAGNLAGTPMKGMSKTQVNFLVSPGRYHWQANNGQNGSNFKVYDNGSINVYPRTKITSNIGYQHQDLYYNDYTFVMSDPNGYGFQGNGEYTISKGGEVVAEEDTDSSWVQIFNLSRGWYEFTFVWNGETVIEENVYSYGEQSQGNMVILNALNDEEVPEYVKFTYAMNPDNCISAYNYFLNDDYQGMLSLNQSLTSLVIFIGICGALGMLAFKKREIT